MTTPYAALARSVRPEECHSKGGILVKTRDFQWGHVCARIEVVK
jgi:hypothetical protein